MKFGKLGEINKEDLPLMGIVTFFLVAFIFCAFISGKISLYLFMLHEYGPETVKYENLTVVETKPKLVISNGDVFDASATTPYYIFFFIFNVLLCWSLYSLINLATRGRLSKLLKKEGLIGQEERDEDKLKIEFPKKWFEDKD